MCNVLATFGSGGHSSEMSMLLKNARVAERMADDKTGQFIRKLVCVISDDDAFIQDKLNDQFFNSFDKFTTVRMRRPRAIKQTYLTTIWTFLVVLYRSFLIVKQHRPSLFLTNGPGISVTLAFAIRFLQIFSWSYRCHILYVESFCRTRTLSLSGKIIYHLRLADEFYVQWPKVAESYPRVKYEGLLV